MSDQAETSRSDSPLGRLAAKQVRRALDFGNRDVPDYDEWIHNIRVAIKRLRAFWLLLTPYIPENVFRHEKRFLRIAARKLSASRNEVAALKTMRKVAREMWDSKQAASAEGVLAALRDSLEQDRASEKTTGSIDSAAALLKGSLHRFEKASARLDSLKLFESGLKRAHREARKAGKISVDSTREKFHRWRKRIKELAYQLEAIDSLQPGSHPQEPVRRLDSLQEELGDLNDLRLLEKKLSKNPSRYGGKKAVKEVAWFLDRRIAGKKEKILRLGRKIPDQEPGIFQ